MEPFRSANSTVTGSEYDRNSKLGYNWLQVLGTTETPQIDQSVRHQFHSVMALLDMLETEE